MLGINEVETDKSKVIKSLIFEVYRILVFELQ